MKVELNEAGVLTVRAENAVESYALDRWADDYFRGQKSEGRPATFVIQPTIVRLAQAVEDAP